MTVSELKNNLQKLFKEFNQSNDSKIVDITITRVLDCTTVEKIDLAYEFEFKIK